MSIRMIRLELATGGHSDVIDITADLETELQRSGLQDGILVVFCPSSTSAVTTIEYESGAVEDLKRAYERLLPEAEDYNHDLRWGDGNGYSHQRASLMGPSLTIPFQGRELQLGTWQQVILVDFDNRPRQREVLIQIIGE